ncbi:CWF19-like protein 2 homolog [Eumeta japonica]|uniref:CWF19-like protein 2 homolog n=1 Tax=Eumeta variegata TaxID=151549 RepID=A0A4C1TP65_EUMVA|nr:CWF19-like protein 2 homolog [Eumeta japonica]
MKVKPVKMIPQVMIPTTLDLTNAKVQENLRRENQLTYVRRSWELKVGKRKVIRFNLQKQISCSSEVETSNSEEETGATTTKRFQLTDQQMNELGAKILKAEIMGNAGVANQLREKLERARIQRNIFKERRKTEYISGKQHSLHELKDQDEHIILTHTDQMGNTRPLLASKSTDSKKKQKRVATHNDTGQRVRYFADDDRYDIKQMFEREKYTNASEANLQFANMAGKHKNPNDDLEDIFAEKISHDDSVRTENKERQKAIREHQKVEKVLTSVIGAGFNKCKRTAYMCWEKQHLSLPWYQGLQHGHCMIVTNEHATCCTPNR